MRFAALSLTQSRPPARPPSPASAAPCAGVQRRTGERDHQRVPNPAALVKTPNPRVKPMVWEPERVQRWKPTGEVPGPVMVWTDDLLGEFLDHAALHAPDLG
jgi:hypothetical protein